MQQRTVRPSKNQGQMEVLQDLSNKSNQMNSHPQRYEEDTLNQYQKQKHMDINL